MWKSRLYRALLASAIAGPLAAQRPADASHASTAPVRVVIETTLGPIVVAIDSAHAPVSAANFLRYVDAAFYTGGRFHRTVTAANQPRDTVRIAVIQGGARTDREGPGWGPIPLERTSETGLRHLNGTLSMARAGPNTATSDFFICIGDQPALDVGGHRNLDGQGFAAFGSVTSGMDVVRAIHASAAEGQRLVPPIVITGMRRAEK